MDKYQDIINKKRISASDFEHTFFAWISPSIMFLLGLFAVYSINNNQKHNTEDSDLILYKLFFIAFTIFSAYLLYVTWNKLRIQFYKNNANLDKKESAITKLKAIKHWRLKKSDKNYFLFFENNVIIPSYYITIVYDDNGFYMNCFPFLGRVIDLGLSKKDCCEIYDELINCL